MFLLFFNTTTTFQGSVPVGLHDLFAKERWYLGSVMCLSIAFLDNCMGFASIASIFFITLDRYFVICQPLRVKSLVTETRTLRLIVAIWSVAIVTNIPFVFLSEHGLRRFSDTGRLEYRCDAKSRGDWSFTYIVSVTFVFYLLVGVVFVVMYYKISRQLSDSTRFLMSSAANKRNSSLLNTSTAGGGGGGGASMSTATITMDSANVNESNLVTQSNAKVRREREKEKEKTKKKKNTSQNMTRSSSSRKKREEAGLLAATDCRGSVSVNEKNLEKLIRQRRKLIVMLICVIFLFYVCLFPLKIWNMVCMVGGRIMPAFFQHLDYTHYWLINITTRIFFYMNSSVNPIVYCFMSKKFRKSFARIFSRTS